MLPHALAERCPASIAGTYARSDVQKRKGGEAVVPHLSARKQTHTYDGLKLRANAGGSPAETASKGEENSNAVSNFCSYLVARARPRAKRAGPGPHRVRDAGWSHRTCRHCSRSSCLPRPY